MADGLVLPPGAGQPIGGAGMTLKVGAGQSEAWSVVKAGVAPGFDVGAHVHQQTEELFYIIEGILAAAPGQQPHAAAARSVVRSSGGHRVSPASVSTGKPSRTQYS